jgi:hypothetical protein
MEQTFTITLTRAQLDIIGTALGELPFKIAAPLFNDINQQITDQAKPPAETPAALDEAQAQPGG